MLNSGDLFHILYIVIYGQLLAGLELNAKYWFSVNIQHLRLAIIFIVLPILTFGTNLLISYPRLAQVQLVHHVANPVGVKHAMEFE